MILPEGPNLITKRETSQDRITLTPGIEFGKVQFNSTAYERVIVDKMFLRRADFKLNTTYNPIGGKVISCHSQTLSAVSVDFNDGGIMALKSKLKHCNTHSIYKNLLLVKYVSKDQT